MNPLELVRYSVSDLQHRWLTAALNIAAIGISVVYVLVLGFYAVNTHQYQHRVVQESGPGEKVVATVPNVSDDTQWFTPERIDQLRQTLGLPVAFPCVELNVDVSLDGRRYDWVPFESTVPGDPTTSPTRTGLGRAGQRTEGERGDSGPESVPKAGRHAHGGRALARRVDGSLETHPQRRGTSASARAADRRLAAAPGQRPDLSAGRNAPPPWTAGRRTG